MNGLNIEVKEYVHASGSNPTKHSDNERIGMLHAKIDEIYRITCNFVLNQAPVQTDNYKKSVAFLKRIAREVAPSTHKQVVREVLSELSADKLITIVANESFLRRFLFSKSSNLS